MLPHPIFFLAPFLLGLSSGLRAMLPGAILLISVRLGYLSLDGTILEFFDSTFFLIAAIFLAVGELVVDKLPFAPNRTAWLGLIARIVSGITCGVILMAALAGNSYISMSVGAVCGLVGALGGTFIGFRLRTWLPGRIGTGDLSVALAEDAIAISLAILAVGLSI